MSVLVRNAVLAFGCLDRNNMRGFENVDVAALVHHGHIGLADGDKLRMRHRELAPIRSTNHKWPEAISLVNIVQSQIELEDVHSGVTEKAKVFPVSVLADEFTHFLFIQPASFGDARDLQFGVSHTDVGVEPAPGSSDGVRRMNSEGLMAGGRWQKKSALRMPPVGLGWFPMALEWIDHPAARCETWEERGGRRWQKKADSS